MLCSWTGLPRLLLRLPSVPRHHPFRCLIFFLFKSCVLFLLAASACDILCDGQSQVPGWCCPPRCHHCFQLHHDWIRRIPFRLQRQAVPDASRVLFFGFVIDGIGVSVTYSVGAGTVEGCWCVRASQGRLTRWYIAYQWTAGLRLPLLGDDYRHYVCLSLLFFV